jgi:hypothetical protein
MIWFKERLYVGTTRANLCMLKFSKMPKNVAVWPVDCPEDLYDLDMRAQVWAYDPISGQAELRFQSPTIAGMDGAMVPRDMGYRGMAIFQGESESEPALYAATYASVKGKGPLVLRTTDGYDFRPVSEYGLTGLPITTIRTLVSFKGRLFTAPTGRAGGNPNISNLPLVYESRDPIKKRWELANEPGFGDPGNLSVFEMVAHDEYLYAGTANLSGFQLWRTTAEGNPPYRWEKVLTRGAYRGSLNQTIVSFQAHRGDLYLGTGIQNGGIDIQHGIGPAAPEIIRVRADGGWDLIVGQERMTPTGRKEPLSGYRPGFNNFFNGYFWRMSVHEGWMYVGSFDWSLMMRYAGKDRWPEWFRRTVERIGMERILEFQAGCDLYRSSDGESWIPVTTNGFDNPYNYGIRGFASSPYGLFVGTANPFGPRVNLQDSDGWRTRDNPRGGLEVWLGTRSPEEEPHGRPFGDVGLQETGRSR